MFYTEHGGDCCGVSHVVGFPFEGPTAENKKVLDEVMKDAVNDLYQSAMYGFLYEGENPPIELSDFSHLLEACLTDPQMVVWAAHLKERGWELQRRWHNSNSGNYVNLLTYAAGTVSETTPPYEW